MEEFYSVEVAKTTTSPNTLKMILERGNDDIVSCYAASNPNCSPEVLRRVLDRGENNWVTWHAASNPNCPPDALAKVFGRENYKSLQ